MIMRVERSATSGTVQIPGSKSHTIRALFLASLAEGESVIYNPLISGDALSAIEACRALGAKVKELPGRFEVKGFGGKPQLPEKIIDVGNSGTTLRIALVTAGLISGEVTFDGDSQIRSRPLGPLMKAMESLGAKVEAAYGNGCAPVSVKGPIKGGYTELDAVTSQFLTALLINAPLFAQDTKIHITRLNEQPYVEMTLWWLDKMGIKYINSGFSDFVIEGRQKYKAFNTVIPGDFSSATFFMVQAAISGGEFTLRNLDMSDPQGDKMVLEYLKKMGAIVEHSSEGIKIRGGQLKGIDIDMNSTPDALPAMAVAGCYASGETRLLNVQQARLKETDRIKVMHDELKKMGADITELEDGLVIRQSKLTGCKLCGHSDHRVVMALAVAGLNSDSETEIDSAEAVNVTFPEFAEIMRACNGKIAIF